MNAYRAITALICWTVIFAGGSHAQTNSGSAKQEGGRLSLQDLVAIAIENNSALQAHRLRYEAANARVPQASALADAKIGFGYFAVPVETRLGPQQATLSLSQSFPWFGTLAAQEDAAKASARQNAQVLADARNLLVMEVRSAWYALHVNERRHLLLEEHQKLLTSLRALAFARYEAGSAPFSQLLRLDMELEKLAAQIGHVQDSRESLLKNLVSRVNRDVSFEELQMRDVLEAGETLQGEGDTGLSTENNPRLNVFAEERAYWQAQAEASRRKGYPTFTVGLTYTAIGTREDLDVADNGRDALLPQIGLSFPLFGSRYGAMAEEARLRSRAAEAAREDAQRRLSAEYAEARRDLADANRRLQLAERLTELSRSAFDILLQEYSTGSTTLEAVLAVERDILRHDLDRVEARAGIARAKDRITYLTAQE